MTANEADLLHSWRYTLTALEDYLKLQAERGLVGFEVSRSSPAALKPHEELVKLRDIIGDCTRCGLARTRTHLVFGEGDSQARLMFIGEGPGQDEDLSGRPFVGRAGKLLDRMIVAMGLAREDVYIANIVKCRPPENRDPGPEEANACIPFLHRQIEIISPRVICTLGRVATQNLLEVKTPLSSLRGKFTEWRGIEVMPTYHPVYLLRYPDSKREAWSDLQQIMGVLGLPKSGAQG